MHIGRSPTIYMYTVIKLCIHTLIALNGPVTDGQMEAFKGGQCQIGQHDVTFHGVTSYLDCVNLCRARSDCLSASVHTVHRECRLHMDSESDLAPQTCRGYVLTLKEEWTQKTISGCLGISCSSGSACLIEEDGVPTCAFKECAPVANLNNGKINGQGGRREGWKLLYQCDDHYKAVPGNVVRICDEITETWDGPAPTCVQNVFDFPRRSGHPDYTLVDLFTYHLSLVGNNDVTFKVKANNDAHVLLQAQRNVYDNDQTAEVIIGGWGNYRTVIRKGLNSNPEYAVYKERGILSGTTYKDFWITRSNNTCIKFGKGANPGENMKLEACLHFHPSYFSIGVGYGSNATFIFP